MAKKNHPVIHFEMPYQDSERLSKFYRDTFGWDMHNLGAQMGDYVMATTTDIDDNNMITVPGTINGGFFPAAAGAPTAPSVVISVDDIHATIKKINETGGNVLGEPMDIPGIGTYVNFMDTEGNRVSILQPVEMPTQ